MKWPKRRLALYASMILLLVLVVIAALRVVSEVTALRSAPRDDAHWTTAQLEIDALRLHLALEYAQTDDGTLGEVRRRFDLFYSRIKTVTDGAVFAEFRNLEDVKPKIERLEAFLVYATPLVDGPDNDLRAALGDIDGQLGYLGDLSREVALQAVHFFADRSDAERDTFIELLTTAIIVGLALILLLGISLLYSDSQRRLAARRMVEFERGRLRLEATTAASLDAILVANAKGELIDWNLAAERIFGRPGAEVIGQNMADLIVPEQHRAAHREGMKRFLETGEKRVIDAGRVELTALRSDGSEFPVELAIAAAESEEGPIFISYLRDISMRLADAKALTEARDAALAADRAKSEFLAVMSHEMRTPLNGVLGLLDLLQSTSLDSRQQEFVENATVSGEVLLRHINDVLDITRIEAGKVSLALETIELKQLVEQVYEIVGPTASANGNTVEIRVPPDLGSLLSDPHRIRQLLLNLIGNAAKFTQNGRIVVEAKAITMTESEVELEVSVSDSGPGIRPEDRDRIFDDFVTLESSYDRTHSGSGLGLAISRRIVERMEGEIGVDDGIEGGSRFWFRLPMKRAVESSAPLQKTQELIESDAPRKILIVEDNEVNRLVLREMLENAGHEVAEACDGREGFEAALKERFDVIIMDVSMPTVDGIEATRLIRANEGPNRDTPILGLTAHAMPDEQQRFISAGMQLCLSKPVRRPELLRQIARWGGDADTGVDDDALMAANEPPLLDEEIFNDMALALSGGRLREIIAKSALEFEQGLEALRAEPDLTVVSRRAHKLAGNAAIIGASRLHMHLVELEDAAKEGQSLKVRKLLTGLAGLIAASMAALEKASET